MTIFNVREAVESDIGPIASLHTSQSRTRTPNLEGGFLLAESTEEMVGEGMAKGTRFFVAIAPETEELVGFVAIAQPQISPDLVHNIRWAGTDYGDRLSDHRHRYIQVVATKPGWTGKGVARRLYTSIYRLFPNSILSALVVTRPITNHRSLHFHIRQGFTAIGTLNLEALFDLENYEGTILYRET
ncbi:MAG: GNAT family N-acetyltransferase [Limnospira sp.]